MYLKHPRILSLLFLLVAVSAQAETIEMPGDVLWDKVRGGLLGQMLGNLNGLPHEFRYMDEPGNVETYTPGLPEGARTDDDTDLEWVYIYTMLEENTLFLPPERIARLWRESINRRIWCANQYARQLMDLGMLPPDTGATAFNPWAEFNISGQFVCETFGLIAPAMPQTAARIGLNYTRTAIDAEPAQATQLFTTMIATAFVTSDIDTILDAGLDALDPHTVLREVIADERAWHKAHPEDWRETRRLTKEKYTRHGGGRRDSNGHELNSAAIIAALLYGNGDFAETLRMAFNFGWDADCNAATAGTIAGVMHGYRALLAHGWPIVDRYENTTRGGMPMDETITSFADRLIQLAESAIVRNGGARVLRDGKPVYQIVREAPACVYPLPGDEACLCDTREPEIRRALLDPDAPAAEKARAAYEAICVDIADYLNAEYPEPWQEAIDALQSQENVVQALFYQAEVPLGAPRRERALAAGLQKPAEKRPLWK